MTSPDTVGGGVPAGLVAETGAPTLVEGVVAGLAAPVDVARDPAASADETGADADDWGEAAPPPDGAAARVPLRLG
jgi:hypothetical protein